MKRLKILERIQIILIALMIHKHIIEIANVKTIPNVIHNDVTSNIAIVIRIANRRLEGLEKCHMAIL